jgi:hypothetical protein
MNCEKVKEKREPSRSDLKDKIRARSSLLLFVLVLITLAGPADADRNGKANENVH